MTSLSAIFAVGLVLVGVVLWSVPAYTVVGEELLAEAERATGAKRAKLYLRLSERSLNQAKVENEKGNSDEGKVALAEFIGYVREAVQTARQTGKHIKETEITLRNFGRKLEDLKRSVPLEDQKPMSDIQVEIQGMRDELMRKMWQK